MLVPDYYESSSSSESEGDEGVPLSPVVEPGIPLTDRLLDDAEPTSRDEAPQIKKRLLPDASELFQQIDRPSFLNPEANKRNKVCAAHLGRQPAEAAAQQQLQQQAEARAREADISKMAPKLKGQPDTQAVLSAPAQRRSEPVGEKKPALIGNDALIALMGGGGHVDMKEKAKANPTWASRSTHATTVEDALAEPSAAQLPRHKQDRKNKEKSKRAAGQSSHVQWKSEAEMVLRQQFDS